MQFDCKTTLKPLLLYIQRKDSELPEFKVKACSSSIALIAALKKHDLRTAALLAFKLWATVIFYFVFLNLAWGII